MSFFPETQHSKARQRIGHSYRPNLVSLMNLCATNYMLLLKIVADKVQVGEQRQFYISDFLTYTLTIKEVTKYTSVVTIVQDAYCFPFSENAWKGNNAKKDENRTLKERHKKTKTLHSKGYNLVQLLHPRMTIRLYHDARMAEVLSSQDVRQIKPRYDYPNTKMHQQDEKQQINQFLNEWLQLCLSLGHLRQRIYG